MVRGVFLLYLFCFGVEIMQEPEPIDWEYYRKGIGSKLVDMYKEAYDSKFPLANWLIVIFDTQIKSKFSHILVFCRNVASSCLL